MIRIRNPRTGVEMVLTPEQMSAICSQSLAMKERHRATGEQDEEAKRTPIGGMQFKAPHA